MPTLVSEADPDRVLQWTCNTLVGRRMVGGLNICGDVETDRQVSSVHAAIFWDRRNATWLIRDLGSSNGTSVDSHRLKFDESKAITKDTLIGFGRSTWRVRDLAPPPAAATNSQGGLRVASDDMLLLPDEGRAEIVVYRDLEGWRMRPYAAEVDQSEPIAHGQRLKVAGQIWTITLPGPGDMVTQQGLGRLSSWRLELSVPATMENIRPTFVRGDARITLPPSRHHELWWLLARARLADREAERPDAEEGWIAPNVLAGQMATDTNYLNVLVHRSRGQVSTVGFTDFGDIIERERKPTRLRLGIEDVRIIQLEA